MDRNTAFTKIIGACNTIGLDFNQSQSDSDQITEETLLSSVIDSLDTVELVMELEKTLPTGTSITDNSVANWNTFKDIVDTYLIATDNE